MQHSKLAPPPPLKAHVLLVVPRAYDMTTGFYVQHLTPYTLLLAVDYTPLPKG